MKIPRPDQASIDLFKSLVPNDPKVTIRPMFGNISAFVNGNMFFGLFGNDLFVRLSDQDQEELLEEGRLKARTDERQTNERLCRNTESMEGGPGNNPGMGITITRRKQQTRPKKKKKVAATKSFRTSPDLKTGRVGRYSPFSTLDRPDKARLMET